MADQTVRSDYKSNYESISIKSFESLNKDLNVMVMNKPRNPSPTAKNMIYSQTKSTSVLKALKDEINLQK